MRTAFRTGIVLDAASDVVRRQAERDLRGGPRVPAHEQADFAKLQNQLAEAKLAQLHNQKHGSEASQAQKAKAAAMLDRQNMHGSGGK